MVIALLAVASYWIGAIPFGVIATKLRGIDILHYGSGNPGATNVWRAAGPKLGLTVFVLDVLKGWLPAAGATYVTGDSTIGLLCGIVAIIGHSLSPFLKFRGGKGISTGLGALLGSGPWVAGIVLSVFILVFVASRIVSLSSICAAIALVVCGFALRLPLAVQGIYWALAVFIIVRHRPNISRLVKGEEPKFKFRNRKQEAADSKPDAEQSHGEEQDS